jgi:lipoprotein NlpI
MLGASTLGFPVDKDAKELWLDPRCQILGQLYSSGWQHDCITLPGNSGGPVLVKDAKSGEERIVAINVSHIAIEGLSDSQSDNLFLKSDDPTYYEYLSIAVPVSAFADKIARYLPADSGLIRDAARLSNERYVKGAEDAAIADLDQALAKTPGAANLLLLRGFWLASKGDIKAALVDWKAAESDKASRPRARYEQARLQLDLGAPDMLAEAQSTFSDLAQEFPDNPELLHFRGLTKARLDDPAGAIADFDAALKTRPESAVIYNERGDAYRAMREYDQALDDYGRAIKLAPDWPEAWRDRGYLQHLRARYAKAERDFERALAIDARDAEAMNGLGLIALSEGDGEGAIAQFNRAIDAAPESSVYLANRGAAAWVEGDLAAALADFDRSIALEPSEPYIWLFEFLALARMDRRAEAAKRLAQYLDTEDAPADWPRALMEYYLGRNSIDALEAALAKAPKDKLEGFRFDRDFYLGEWALVRGDRTSALSRLKAVLDSQLREYLEYDLARADYLALGGTLEE